MEDEKKMRNYDQELADTSDHEYAYDFDFDVMHHFMLRAFRPFLQKGRSLELGSFKGDFTKKLIKELVARRNVFFSL